MQTEIWPLDVSKLQPGSVISVEEIERITGISRDAAAYSLEALRLTRWIEQMLLSEGRKMSLCQVRGAIRCLTDNESSDYNARGFVHGLRKAVRCNVRMSWIDPNNLTQNERRKHLQRQEFQSRILQATEAAERKAALRESALRESALIQATQREAAQTEAAQRRATLTQAARTEASPDAAADDSSQCERT